MANVEIKIKGVDDASDEIKQVNKSMESMDKTMGGLNVKSINFDTATNNIKKTLGAVVEIYDNVIGQTLEYADRVDRLSRVTGSGAEETSRLIQVADDMKVSYEELEIALQGAVRKGVDPSVESLAKMSDQYLALQPGLEQTKFLMDNFGRSGADLARIMDKGGKAIREMGAAVDEGLIMTDEAIVQAREYELAVDNLEDSFSAVKYTIAKEVIPVLVDLLETNKNVSDSIVDNTDNFRDYEKAAGQAGVRGAALLTEEQYNQAKASGVQDEALEDVTEQMDLAAKEAEDLALAEAELKTKTDLINSSMKQLTTELLYQRASAGLDADAALELARSMGLMDENAYNALSSLQELREKYDTNKDGAIDASEGAKEYAREVRELKLAVDSLESKTITVRAQLENVLIRSEWDDMIRQQAYGGPKATGGPVLSGRPYMVGERGPELFVPGQSGNIVPNDRLGGTNINITYAPGISLGSRQELVNNLQPIIMQAVRDAKMRGGYPA